MAYAPWLQAISIERHRNCRIFGSDRSGSLNATPTAEIERQKVTRRGSLLALGFRVKARARGHVCLLALTLAATTACSSLDDQLRQHRQKLESLGATTEAVGEAWLAGSVSPTYTRTALEQTLVLVEDESAALARTPGALAAPGGAGLSQSAERLSRLLADLTCDVRSGNRPSARRHLTEIPIKPRGRL